MATDLQRSNESSYGNACVMFFDYPSGGTKGEATDILLQTDDTLFGKLALFANETLNYLSRSLQPQPKLAHCELAMVSQNEKKTHFATYIGSTASWVPTDDFYATARARAVPIVVDKKSETPKFDTCSTLRLACLDEEGAPYSIAMYLSGIRTTNFLAPLFSSSLKSPVHCSGLVVRVLKNAFPCWSKSTFKSHSATYSPSKVYNELTRSICFDGENQMIWSTEHDANDDVARAISTLLYGSSAEVAAMSWSEYEMTLESLANAVVAALSRNPLDTNCKECVVAQRNYARGLVRVSLVIESRNNDIRSFI